MVHVGGEVDAYTAPQLRDALGAVIDAGAVRVVVDVGGVEFMDSTGLAVLVSALKRLQASGGDLRLANPRRIVARLFAITGIDRVFGLSRPAHDTAGH